MKLPVSSLVLAVLLAPAAVFAASEPLFSSSTGEVRRDDGSTWRITVTEIERSARTSTLRVTQSGRLPSVGSSLFVACSVMKLARERGFRYVAQLEHSGAIQLGFLDRIEDDAAKVLGPGFAALAAGRRYDAEFMAPICDAPQPPDVVQEPPANPQTKPVAPTGR